MVNYEDSERNELRRMVDEYCVNHRLDGKFCRDCVGNCSRLCSQVGFFLTTDIEQIRKDVDILCFGDGSVKLETFKDDKGTPKAVGGKHNYRIMAHLNDKGEIIEIFGSTKEASEKTGATPGTLRAIANGERKHSSYGKWLWMKE